MTTYKKQYTTEEIGELITWFEAHFDRLPESLQVDKATFIKDIKKTVKLYFDIARQHINNPTYSGQINHLFQIKEALTTQGLVN